MGVGRYGYMWQWEDMGGEETLIWERAFGSLHL